MTADLHGGRRGTAGCPALRRCVGIEPDIFAERHWGRRPLLSPAAHLPTTFDDLLTLHSVDELLSSRGLRTPFLRVARDGTVVSSAEFTGSGGVGAQVADQVIDDRVLRLFAEGCTLVLQGLHRLWPPLIEFAGQLGLDLGHPVQVNAYVTPASSRGFAAHYDVHDVFVLQVAGQKRWTVHDPVHQAPLRTQPWQDRSEKVADRAAQPPLLDEVLSPGDALYLPRGYLHSAQALGGVSAHLTVGVHVVTRYHLVEALVERLRALAGEEPELRAALPLGIDVGDPAQLEPLVTATMRALVHTMRDSDPAEVARLVRDRVWAGSRPSPIRPLGQARAAAIVAPGDRVRMRAGLRHAMHTDSEQVVLDLPGDQLVLPAPTAPALAVLLSGDPVPVGELPGLAVSDQIGLVGRLLREGVLVPLGEPGTVT
jgi:hypothetical protein